MRPHQQHSHPAQLGCRLGPQCRETGAKYEHGHGSERRFLPARLVLGAISRLVAHGLGSHRLPSGPIPRIGQENEFGVVIIATIERAYCFPAAGASINYERKIMSVSEEITSHLQEARYAAEEFARPGIDGNKSNPAQAGKALKKIIESIELLAVEVARIDTAASSGVAPTN